MENAINIQKYLNLSCCVHADCCHGSRESAVLASVEFLHEESHLHGAAADIMSRR